MSQRVKPEPLHDLVAYPSSLHLLHAARSALRHGLAESASAPSRAGAIRQLNAILRELIHREDGIEALLDRQNRDGKLLLIEAQGLLRRFEHAAPAKPVSVRQGSKTRRLSPQARYSRLGERLSAVIAVLWDAWALTRAPRMQQPLMQLTGRIAAWESRLVTTLGQDPAPMKVSQPRKKRARVPTDEQILACMRAAGFGPPDLEITELHRLSGGFSRATWMLVTQSTSWGTRPFVIRQQLDGGIVQGIAAELKQEYPLLGVLHSEGLPVPRPLLLVTAPNPFGNHFMIVDKLPGRAIGNSTGASDVADVSLLKNIAIMLARLHAVDWVRHRDALRGTKVWHKSAQASTRDLATDLVERWQTFTSNNIGTTSPSVAAGFAWLRANIPAGTSVRPSIVHGDVTFANMLEHGGELTALLDWEVTCLGDPAKDVAHIKPVVERRMSWATFMDWYVEAGGPAIDDSTLRFYEIFKAVTHVAVTYVARGRRFSDDPAARPDLTEIGLNQPQIYLPELLEALHR